MPKGIFIAITGSAAQFANEIDKAVGSTQKLGKAAGVVGGLLAVGLGVGLERSVKAAMAGQVSQAQLDSALKATHQSLTAMAPALTAAESASRRLGFADDDTRAALARLETATGDTKKAVADLSVAEDVSRLKHTDLANATGMLAQAMTGSQRAAKQLGISVAPLTTTYDELKATMGTTIDASEKLALAHARLTDKELTGAAVIDAVSAKVAGQGQAFADSAAGGLAQFHAQTQHLEESLGTLLLPAIATVSTKLASLTSFLSEHTAVAKLAVGALAGLATTTLIAVSVATKLQTAAIALANVATKAWEAAQWLLNAALTANPIGIVIVAVAALAAGIAIAYEHSATFRRIVGDAFQVVKNIVADVVAGILGSIDLFLAGLQKMAQAASHLPFVGDKFRGIANDIGTARAAVEGLQAAIDGLHDKAITITTYQQTALSGDVKHHALGGLAQAGEYAMVGERGPEMVLFGQSARVFPAGSRVAVAGGVSGGGGGAPVVSVNVYGWVGNDQALADRIGKALIGLNRRGSLLAADLR